MSNRRTRLYSPIWHYLNQSLFDRRQPAILDPRRFWRYYNVDHLERCLAKSLSEKQ